MGLITFIKDFVENIGPSMHDHQGVKWGNVVMMKPYDGWYDYIKALFDNLGFMEILLIVASALLWTGVYLIIIYKLVKNHAPSMPWLALCLNFSWEFQFAFLVPYPEPVTRWGIYLWVVFDAVMYCLDLRYGKLAFATRWGKQYAKAGYYYTIKVGLFIILFLTVLATNAQWPSLPDAPMFAAYLMNAVMSFLFITHLLHKETIEGTSIYMAWCKFLGTVAPSILGFMWMPGNYFVYMLAIICALVDTAYIVVLSRRYIRFGVNPYTGKPIAGREDTYAETMAALEDYKERSTNFKW